MLLFLSLLLIGLIIAIVYYKKSEEESNTTENFIKSSQSCGGRTFHMDYKLTDEVMANMYGLDKKVTAFIVDMIVQIVQHSNNKFNKSVGIWEISEYFFRLHHKEFLGKSVEDIENIKFGIFYRINQCYILFIDENYMGIKKEGMSRVKMNIEGYTSDELKNDWNDIMDSIYISLMDEFVFQNKESNDFGIDLDNHGFQIDGGVLFDLTLVAFMEKYNLTDTTFLEEL